MTLTVAVSEPLAAGLRFIPLAHERSDLVIPLDLSREPRGARMLDHEIHAAYQHQSTGAVITFALLHPHSVTADAVRTERFASRWRGRC